MNKTNECNGEKHKESCKYSIEISKQFITLSSAGIAFIVGLAIAPNTDVSNYYYLAGGSCLLSICFGLIYIMSAIAHINKHENYDVYTSHLRFFSTFQILFFLVGVVFLIGIVNTKINEKPVNGISPSSYNLHLRSGDKEIKQLVGANSKLEVLLSEDGNIKLTVEPIK